MLVLERGATGDAVMDVQARLTALGYRIDPGEHGTFGSATEAAVRSLTAAASVSGFSGSTKVTGPSSGAKGSR